jgi:hypothetical protein
VALSTNVTTRQLFNKGNWVFSYDLKSAYHHLQMFPADRMYLGFQWENMYYVYNVLPFGLATSGYIFERKGLNTGEEKVSKLLCI